MLGAQQWVWGCGNLVLSSTEVGTAVPGVGAHSSGTSRCPGPLCPELCGTEEGAPGTRACAEVWPCHMLLLSVPWDPLQPTCAWGGGCPVAPRQGVPARWHFPGPAESCHWGFCQSEVT